MPIAAGKAPTFDAGQCLAFRAAKRRGAIKRSPSRNGVATLKALAHYSSFDTLGMIGTCREVRANDIVRKNDEG